MKLHREIKVTQKTAWFMLHRLRDSFSAEDKALFSGPCKVDETYIGSREKNKHSSKKIKAGRGPVGKAAVVGIKDRKSNQIKARVVEQASKATLTAFITDSVSADATVYTDEHRSYQGLAYQHETVKHHTSEYVNGQAHTNGMESFWSFLKRVYHGIYHHMSKKHLDRYIQEFSGRHNIRNSDTAAQMEFLVECMVGKRFMYKDLVR